MDLGGGDGGHVKRDGWRAATGICARCAGMDRADMMAWTLRVRQKGRGECGGRSAVEVQNAADGSQGAVRQRRVESADGAGMGKGIVDKGGARTVSV